MTSQSELELTDDPIERMLAQRAGPVEREDLLADIAAAAAMTAQLRPWLVPSRPLPPSRRGRLLLVAALLVIAALAATIASVGSNLQRNQNDLIVEPTSSVAPHLSLPPTLSPSGAPAVASWSATGSLITARSQTNLILLGDGRVLAVGGCSDLVCHALASAEIYDPATRSWSATASMTQARSGNSATLLQNGKVLVAGGSAFGQIGDASAALFDPASGSWSATGNMLEPRSGHSATLLPNGKVLVAGGTTDRPCAAGVPGHCFDELSSAELYDPRTGMWSATGSMTVGRVGHPAILLGDGKVLVVGGAYFPRDSADVYDATTGTWRATGRMTAKREFQTATLLPDGKVLVAGGRDASHSPVKRLASAEQYDPTTSRWSATGSMAIGLIGHTATLLADGKVLVLGDRGGGTSGSDAELYDPATGLWGATPTWISSLGPCAGIRLADGRVLIVGGVSNGHVLESSEIYDPGDLR